VEFIQINFTKLGYTFKNQPDVWIEVWNEPYRYDRADGYTDAIWITDMNEMVLIRDTGNQNIIVVPLQNKDKMKVFS
jgi:hypothetical protein